MICERCGDDMSAGRLVVRRTFAGFSCHPCADEVKRTEWEGMNMAKKNGKSNRKIAGAKAAESNGPLAAIIDPMLFSGDKTVKEIAAELAKMGGEAAKGKDLAANVRARMVSYTRKGWRVEKDDQKRVMVVQQKG
ncbi:MAG: hypothetical protein ACYCPQ_00490 [Elusimicrobiota bacterium]